MKGEVRVHGSIRRRLTLMLLGGAAVLAVILYLLVLNFARQVAEEAQDDILTASVTSILESVSARTGGVSVDIPYAALSMLGNVSDDRVFYRIDADAALLTGYGDLPPVAGAAAAGEVPRFATRDYRGESIRQVSATRSVILDGRPVPVTATVAQTRNGQARTLAAISANARFLGVGFFLVSGLLAVLAAQGAMRPLRQLAGAVGRRGPKDLRPVTAPVPSEMAPLVGALNGFIARLKTSLARSEDFIAEAAHRVRTPLATVRTQAEIALRRVERPENRKSLREMIRAIDESSRAAGQLLDHAMVTFRTDHLEREEVALDDLVADTVDRLRPVAELKDIAMLVETAARTRIEADPILVQNAVRNILDNAIKYAPRDSDVAVRVKNGDGMARITVRDGGAGFPNEGAERLTERFARGANAADTVGSGLGLTIAREVAEAHGGALVIANNTEGPGACVTLSFPLS